MTHNYSVNFIDLLFVEGARYIHIPFFLLVICCFCFVVQRCKDIGGSSLITMLIYQSIVIIVGILAHLADKDGWLLLGFFVFVLPVSQILLIFVLSLIPGKRYLQNTQESKTVQKVSK